MAARILIVGGGVIGLSTAYYCALRGHKVTVVDRAGVDEEGCSHRNAGMIVPSHFVPLAAPGAMAQALKWMWNPESPFYVKPRLDWDLLSWAWKFYQASEPARAAQAAPLLRDLSLASRACFEKLAALPERDFGLTKRGLLMLCQSDHVWKEEAKTAETAAKLNIPAQVLNASQTAALEPNVEMNVAGSVYFPLDCHLDPARFISTLRAELQQMGASLVWETQVEGWRKNGPKIEALVTSRGEMEAEEFILCGGIWSTQLGRDLGLNLPMQAGKGYSLTIPNPRQLPKICSILTEARVAVTPIGTMLRCGGTMEMAGLNRDTNPVRVQGIIKSVPRYYPAFKTEDFSALPVWNGLRPCSPDGLPYIGRTASYRNLCIATGHAMMGLSLGPITGKLVAELVTDERTELNIQLLNPDRYR